MHLPIIKNHKYVFLLRAKSCDSQIFLLTINSHYNTVNYAFYYYFSNILKMVTVSQLVKLYNEVLQNISKVFAVLCHWIPRSGREGK